MDNFRQVFEPIVKAYNRFLYDSYMVDITQYKGGQSIGTDWVSRHFQTHIHHIKDKFYGLKRRFAEVELSDLLEDNWFRLILLNGFDRASSIMQANPALRTKFFKPNSVSFALTEVTQGGIFQGWFRGALVNTLQFSAVVYPALYLANTYEFGFGKLGNFLSWLLVMDTLLYPLDKIKTLLYADTRLEYKNLAVLSEIQGLKSAYSGVTRKLVFNVPWAWAAYTTVNDSSILEKALAWGTVAIFYPINAIKTVKQLNGTMISAAGSNHLYRGYYRGFLPFAIANALGATVLHNLAGAAKQKEYAEAFNEDVRLYDQGYHFPPNQVL